MTPATFHQRAACNAAVRTRLRSTPRRGFTLIHMMTVIAMLSIMMTMTGVIIQFLLRSDQSVSQQAVLELTVFELSRQFRDDVHAAIQCDLQANQPPADSLELSGPAPQSHVKYRVDGENLIRESLEGARKVSREVYRLPECQVRFRRDGSDADQAAPAKGPLFLALDIDRAGLVMSPQQKPVRGQRKLTVVAELVRSQQLLTAHRPETTTRSSTAVDLKEQSVPGDRRNGESTP